MVRRSQGIPPVGAPPDPLGVRTVEDLTARLRLLQAWAGVGYREIHRRVVKLRANRGVHDGLAYNTVYRCLQPGRARLDVELVADIACVAAGEEAAVAWRLACQIIAGRGSAAGIVSARTALPDDLAGFVGRGAELAQVVDAHSGGGLVVVEGMAGVGKTALAVRAAHRLLDRYPDLRLWVNLRGYDPAQPPADPAAVLEAFLRLLGVPGDQIYRQDVGERSALFRRLLSTRRALLVLDNAATEEQVRPLLPQSSGCLTVITTRHALPGLPAERLRLEALTGDEALLLLRDGIGAGRVDAAPETALRLAESVGRLPLALGLLAGRINDSPEWTLADHLARLTERRRQGRLDRGVELALDLSYDELRPPTQRMFRLVSLHRGGDLDVYAAAALAGVELPDARKQLDELVAANLLQRPSPLRFQLHDVVGVYAGACATDGEPEASCRAALTRLFDQLLATAAQAVDILYPSERSRRPRVAPPRSPVPPLDTPGSARAWLEGAYPSLMWMVAHTARCGWPTHAGRLPTIINRWLAVTGRYGEAITVHEYALEAARASRDRAAEGRALVDLGGALWRLGRNAEAADALELATSICQEVGDRLHEGRAYGNLGAICTHDGQYERALERFSKATEIYREVGDRSGEGRAACNAGNALAGLGRYHDAIARYRLSLSVGREVGDRVLEGLVLGNLCENHARVGDAAEARECYHQALAIHRDCGHRAAEAAVLAVSYRADPGAGYQVTLDRQQRAVAIARELGDPELEARARNHLGAALRAFGQLDDSHAEHQTALALAREVGHHLELARAHDGLADLACQAGRTELARDHWQQALATYTMLGVPQAAQAREQLSRLES